jgi:excisionase family DNA binding protein
LVSRAKLWFHLDGSDQSESKAHIMERYLKYPTYPTLAYSIKQASKISSLGKTTLYRHAKLGSLRMIRVGGRTVIPAESLHALLEGGE